MGNFLRKLSRKKGIETVSNVLGAVFIGAIVIFFFYYIFPLFFGDMFKSIALTSTDVVARDLAGLVSVSGVAPDQIVIEYNPSSSIQYNVSIASRIVSIGLPISKGNLASNLGVTDVSTAKTALDNLTVRMDLENNFEISKTIKSSNSGSGNPAFQPFYAVIGKSNLGVK